MNKIIIVLLAGLVISQTALSQNTTKITGEKNKEYRDSLENAPRAYVFPIWGDRVQRRGYDLPLPAGVFLGYVLQNQDLALENLSISVGGSDLINIDDLVSFSTLNNTTNVLTFRPDVWIFPFLNVYAIATAFDAKTDIVVSEPIVLEVPQANNRGGGGGFGLVTAYGIGRIWFSGNFNFSWSKTPQLIRPTQSFSTSLRVGTTFYTNNRKHHVNPYVGASYLDYKGTNGGTYDMTQLLPDDGTLLQDLQEQVQEMLDGMNQKYEDFCAMPGNMAKCAVIDPFLQEFQDRIDDKLSGIDPPEELPLGYQFDSSPANNWNGVAGIRYHLNKKWDFQVEAGFGGRNTLLTTVTYRYGIKEKQYRDKN